MKIWKYTEDAAKFSIKFKKMNVKIIGTQQIMNDSMYLLHLLHEKSIQFAFPELSNLSLWISTFMNYTFF